jgi:hypothetical protein
MLLIANSLPGPQTHTLHLSETPDNGIVFDAAAAENRIVCILREGYAHVMSGPPDNMIDKVFQSEGFSVASLLGFLKTLTDERGLIVDS